MDAEILLGVVAEAESYLPAVLEGVCGYAENGARIDDLKNSQRLTQTIKGAAQMVGLSEISEIAAGISSELSAIAESRNPLGAEKTEAICGDIMRLETAIKQARNDLGDVSKQNRTGSLDSEDSIQSFQTEEPTANGEDAFDDFEIDPEMLEVFAMEAEEHLRNIAVHLETLEKNINDRSALLEIRRSAHTLKGSAGIVGFKKLSALAHRVEDLLDFMAENEIAGDQSVFELLLASTECLQALAGGQNSAELEEAIAIIYRRFDEIFAALKAPPKAGAPVVVPPAVENEDVGSLGKEPESTEAADFAAPNANQPRSVVRVSLERLDDLVRLAGEMVIARAAMERHLREAEHQIQELRLATSRLRRTALRLEVDFEANTLANKKPGATDFNPPGQTPNASSGKTGEFDALEFDNYTEFHQTTRALSETASDTAAVNAELDQMVGSLGLLFDHQHRLIEQVQDNLLRLRMVPLISLAPRLHRTVRLTANEEEKLAELVIENEDLEIDTQILDSFAEPLLHLLKNAVGHGIETPAERRRAGKPERGRITLRAASEGTHVVFTVSDDGRGISARALKDRAVSLGFVSPAEAAAMPEQDVYSLVFLPGLSTASRVTQVSGRGVGMNAVKASITRRQGTISVDSAPGRGASFTVRLPASLAVTRALLVKAAGEIYAFPLKLVKQIAEISASEMEKARAAKSVAFGGRNYRLAHFNDLLGVPAAEAERPAPLLLLEGTQAPCALIAEQIVKPEEIVVKPLGSLLSSFREVVGASVLGDGRVVPVLDLMCLLDRNSSKIVAAPAPIPAKIQAPIRVLVVDDSPSVRQVMSKFLKNAGLDVTTAKDGLDALETLQAARVLPSVILSDVEMPRMDGYGLLAALREQPNLRRIPVVMITSRAGEKHRRKGLDLGAADYVSKPFDETALLNKINELASAAV